MYAYYPYSTQYYGKYPRGHPEVITNNFKPIDEYYGLVKCRVLPPRGLYHPVLPYRSNGRLKFPLCRTCSDNESVTQCSCTPDKRALLGVWTTPELMKALEKGYELTKIYEVYHFPETIAYSPETGEEGLFHQYIATFLKIKQEASGYPDWAKSEQHKDQYIESFYRHHGILLTKENIKKNEGLRSLAKLCLNSLWGKFGQNDNLTQREYVYDGKTLVQKITDKRSMLIDFHILNKKCVIIDKKQKTEYLKPSSSTNIFVAVFTTALARLTLYNVLDQLSHRVLYFDTDSVIYSQTPQDEKLEHGDNLGQLTSELDTGDHITHFVSGGPKNYAYKTMKNKTCVKVKGLSLTHETAKLVNFDSMLELVTTHVQNGDSKFIETINPHKIKRCKKTCEITTQQETKRYRCVYTKRQLCDNYDTLPYGY